jgi:murein hydrolase activator
VSRERTLRRNLRDLERILEEKATEHAHLQIARGAAEAGAEQHARAERSPTSACEQLARDERRLSELVVRWSASAGRRSGSRPSVAARLRRALRRARPPLRGPGSPPPTCGRFGWPVDGRVLYRFGRVTQPNGTILRFNGIGIGAPPGRAWRDRGGTVVMAGPFEGYGPTVVLSHGGGYYSLYLYLRDLAVREGDEVTRSQVIGAWAARTRRRVRTSSSRSGRRAARRSTR